MQGYKSSSISKNSTVESTGNETNLRDETIKHKRDKTKLTRIKRIWLLLTKPLCV